jgi:hypothetical protein
VKCRTKALCLNQRKEPLGVESCDCNCTWDNLIYLLLKILKFLEKSLKMGLGYKLKDFCLWWQTYFKVSRITSVKKSLEKQQHLP